MTGKTVPLALPSDQDASGRTLGDDELKLLREAIESGTLTSTKGRFVAGFEREFARLLGSKHAYACSSGTAAVHCAVAAINPEPGEEIITSPITDMGALTPILYQGAIPVFADVDPKTWNVTAETISERISDRTRAILVTHLFGNPCPMREIMQLAQARSIPVIEDCSQSFLARSGERNVGTIGAIGCFSLQQGKHITTGEGGIVTTDDPQLARRMFLFINKAWGYGDAAPDHYFLALNYRMSELQGAVALAQLPKLASVVKDRVTRARQLTERLRGLAGIETPWIAPENSHVYWKYPLRVDAGRIPGGCTALSQKLTGHGICSVPRYIRKPAFMCELFQKQRTLGNSRFPFTLARPEAIDYRAERFPGVIEGLERVLVLPWNERYGEEHVEFLADSIHAAVADLGR